MAHLELHTPEGVQRVPLGRGSVVLGRRPQSGVTVDDALVSREHCAIAALDDGYELRDLDSRNGTLMGGLRVVKVKLRPGAEFQVGNTRVVFMDDRPAEGRPRPKAREQAAARKPAASRPLDPSLRGHVTVAASQPAASDDDDLAKLFAVGDDEGVQQMRGSTSNYGVDSLESLATVGVDVPFGVDELNLVNARGQTVHPAETGRREAAESLHMLRLVLYGCIRSGASDIHVEPKRHNGVIRLRIDGAMVEVTTLDATETKRLTSLIKVLCDIDIAKKEIIQEGHFSCKAPGRQVDYRISFTPSMFGQKLVIRVLDPFNAPQRLKDLALPEWQYLAIRNLSRQNTGMLLTCGPTGSGKTTTLYATLREVDAGLRNVITIEDPVEYEVDGVTQIPVDSGSGQTFAQLLRSVLRQDPDVVVLGEIRDAETATTAMQAANTGHLVLSTIHAKDTIGTIFRLLDLGVEPYLIASTLNLVLAQRLVRLLCPHCKVARTPTPQQQMRLGKSTEGLRKLYVPAGCAHCFGTGYSGRQGVYELLQATDDLRDVILHSPNMGKIKKAMEMTMFTSLRDSGADLVLRGETSLDEIERVIGID